MTAAQNEAREERLAIMMFDGGLTEAEAQIYCNRHPAMYGLVEVVEKQEGLFE